MSSRRAGPPPELPGFRYLEILGTGGFADVYKYEQVGLGRHVGIKVLLADSNGDYASFGVESSVMARLSTHPSIVSVYQAGVTSTGRPFLVMEYCPPPHLAQRVKTKPLSVAKALEITIQLAGAAETAHRLGILHRDIKPANILFTDFGRPALTDFGISVSTSNAAAGSGMGMSVPWAPPEQLSTGSPMDQTGDVYSLAATLWTTLVGRSPFSQPGGDNGTVALAHRIATQPVPPTRREDVPASLERTLQTAMSKRPSERYGSALEFARALQGIQVEMHQPVTPIEVREDPDAQDDAGSPPEEPDTPGTRVVGFVSIDPSGTTPSTTPSTTPGTTRAVTGTYAGTEPVDDTGRATPLDPTGIRPVHVPGPSQPSPAPEPAAARRRGLAAWALGLVAVLLVVAAGVAYARDRAGTETPSDPAGDAAPQDYIGTDAPQPPELTSVRLRDGFIRLAWRNPDPQPEDTYRFRLDDPAEDPVRWHLAGSETRGVVEPKPGRGCVMVVTVRGSTQSEPATACATRGKS